MYDELLTKKEEARSTKKKKTTSMMQCATKVLISRAGRIRVAWQRLLLSNMTIGSMFVKNYAFTGVLGFFMGREQRSAIVQVQSQLGIEINLQF